MANYILSRLQLVASSFATMLHFLTKKIIFFPLFASSLIPTIADCSCTYAYTDFANMQSKHDLFKKERKERKKEERENKNLFFNAKVVSIANKSIYLACKEALFYLLLSSFMTFVIDNKLYFHIHMCVHKYCEMILVKSQKVFN